MRRVEEGARQELNHEGAMRLVSGRVGDQTERRVGERSLVCPKESAMQWPWTWLLGVRCMRGGVLVSFRVDRGRLGGRSGLST